MTTTPKTATAQGVSRTLAKRFTRSTSTGSMVRGYRIDSPGFKVTVSGTGAVRVHHEVGSGSAAYRGSDSENIAAHNRKVAAYAALLTEAGYAAVIVPNGTGTSIHDRETHIEFEETVR